jgi:hypothetical protein
MNFWSFLDKAMDNIITLVLTLCLMVFAFIVLVGAILLL